MLICDKAQFKHQLSVVILRLESELNAEYFAENVRNLGKHSIHLQVVLNESNSTTFAGKPLPSTQINFTVTGK